MHEVEMIEPSETQGVDGAVEFCGVLWSGGCRANEMLLFRLRLIG